MGDPLHERDETLAALRRVVDAAWPRFYHFVIGGSTPSALAADWVVSLLDQNAFVRASSRFADAAETVTLDRLRELGGCAALGELPAASGRR